MASPEAERLRSSFGDKYTSLAQSITSMRAAWEEEAAAATLPPGVAVQPEKIGEREPEWVISADASDGVLLWVHGGGYNSGSPRTVRSFSAQLALATGLRVLSSDYRLAPEHSYPGGVEDVVEQVRWLFEKGFQKVAIGGESSGGGTALAALVALRDRGLPLPRAAVLISPWLDLTLTSASLRTRESADPLVSCAALARAAGVYVGTGDPKEASPLYADLHGLPRLLVIVGADEVLLDDSCRLAERAREVGVDVELNVAEGMWHVYPAMGPDLPEARDALAAIGAFLRRS